tara:strand:- start:33 stop:1007 length:975 start_codon:yes stop_codon:yes gene_type:complete
MTETKKTALSNNATLIRLTTKHWSGIKADKLLREDLAQDVNAVSESLHVSKHLVGKNANKYFRRIINQVRNNIYYPLTLPWDDNSSDLNGKVVSGWRLCPNREYDRVWSALEDAKKQFFKEVDAFCDEYPDLIEQAKVELGDAFKQEDYPEVWEIRQKFKFDIEPQLIPSAVDSRDIRLNISAEVQAKIEEATEQRIKRNVANIFKTTVEALVEQVEHIADKLASYDPKDKESKTFFKNSSFDKLRQAIEVLPSINADILGNDPFIAQSHQSLVSVFAQINDLDSLRDDTEIGESKRKKVSTELSDAIDPIKSGLLGKLGGKDD